MARRFASSGFSRSCILLPLIAVLLSAAVARGDTEVALTSDHPTNQSRVGEIVAFTATVTDKSESPGVPTGYVKFKEGDLVLGRAQLQSGAATFATAVLSVGSHDIQAFYEGDGPFPPSSTGTALPHVVEAAWRAVVVEVLLTPNPVTFGEVSAVQVNVHDDPANPSPPGTKGAFTSLSPAVLASARSGHSSTLLPDGTVWIAGGQGGLATSQIYSVSGGFASGPDLTDGTDPSPRTGHTATRLQDGRILIVGGSSNGNAGNVLASALIYDPAQNTFAVAGTLGTPRMNHTATLLANGKVLIAGGTDATHPALDSTEVFDGTEFHSGPALTPPRAGHTATLLPSGAILIAGGDTSGSAQLYILNPAGDAWQSSGAIAGGLHVPRTGHTATLLPDGNVLIAGGENLVPTAVSSTEMYDARSNSFVALAGTMDFARTAHSATLLNDGRVLFLGGVDDSTPPSPLDSGALYTPSFDPQGSVVITSNSAGGTPVDVVSPLGACVLSLTGTGTTFCTGSVQPGQAGSTVHEITGAFTVSEVAPAVHSSATGKANLTVNKAVPTITWPAPADIVYGTPLALGAQLNATASVPGAFVYTPGPDTILALGAHQLQVDFTPDDADSYTTASSEVAINVTPKALTIIDVTATNKTYNGSKTASLNIADAKLEGVEPADKQDVQLDSSQVTGLFLDASVADGKHVDVSGFALSGDKASNYTLAQPDYVTANITQMDLPVTGVTANNKTYNGKTEATLNVGSAAIPAVLPDDKDKVALHSTGAKGDFDTKTVGDGKTVTVMGFTIDGTQAGNYKLLQPAGVTANIIAADLYITGVKANSKTYDGGLSATLDTSDAALSGVADEDKVNLDKTVASGVFLTKTAGDGKDVTVSGFTISGDDAGNYTLHQPTGITTKIERKDLPVTGVTAADKTYDGTRDATLNTQAAAIPDKVPSDIVTLAYSGVLGLFVDKNVGDNKSVAVSGFTISGDDVANYNLLQPANVKAKITAKSLLGSITVSDKVYDSTPDAAIATRSLEGVIVINGTRDDVSYSGGTATFENEHVGDAISVTATGLTLIGTDAGNYTVNDIATATANISRAELVISAAGVDKTYDGATTATVTLAHNGVPHDELTTSYASASFADEKAGLAKPVTVSDISVAGSDAVNYTPNKTTTTTARITPLAITGEITVDNKVYDGTTVAVISGRALHGVLGDDKVTLIGETAAFSDKNVGANKTVTATGLALSDADASNYTTSSTVTGTASITPASTSTKVASTPGAARDGSYQLTATIGWLKTTEVPPGSVTFSDSGATLQTVAVDSAGHAVTSLMTLPLTTGSHTIKAAYTPDATLGKNFTGSEMTMVIVVSAPVSTQPGRVLAQPVSVTTTGGVSVQCRVDSLAPVPPPTTLFPGCDVNPKTIGAGASTLTVQIQTVAGTSARMHGQKVFYAMWLVAGLAFLPLGAASRARRHRRLLTWLAVVLVAAVFCVAVGCGGGFNNPQSLQPNVGGSGATQPGQYVIVITGSDSPSSSIVLASVPVNVQY